MSERLSRSRITQTLLESVPHAQAELLASEIFRLRGLIRKIGANIPTPVDEEDPDYDGCPLDSHGWCPWCAATLTLGHTHEPTCVWPKLVQEVQAIRQEAEE
jgi:hypothetical protein